MSIYATWNENRLFLVIHMMKIWVEWITPPTIRNRIFVAEGRILINGSKLYGILIYYSHPNTSRAFSSALNILETCSSYSVGEPITGVVPEPYYYTGIKATHPLKWVASEQYFSVEFSIKFVGKEGLYAIVIWWEHTSHQVNKERYRSYLPILEYTFLAKSG